MGVDAEDAARTNLITWRADSVQAVAFVMPGAPQPDALGIWSALSPEEGPEAFQKPSGAPNAVSTASGPEGSSQLAVTSQIGRIDIVRHGRAAPNSSGPPTLDNLQEAMLRSAAQLKKILSLAPIYRLAIVASLSTNAEEGFSRILSSVADGITFPENATDCIYQLNVRRRSSAKAELEINRLCTWSSGEQSLISFNVGGPGFQATGNSPMTIRSVPIVNFNIDVNTATGPGFGIAPPDAALIDELAAEVGRLAQRGVEALQ